jgi:hypothetical protein
MSGGPGCNRDTIEMLVSPSDDFVAFVREEVCAGPGILDTGISDVVTIARWNKADQISENEEDVFSLEEHGDPKSRPILMWTDSLKLQITVQNTSLIWLHKMNYKCDCAF